MIDFKQFKKLLAENKCPFCEEKLDYYNGTLGYESWNCPNKHMMADINGMRINTHKED